MSRLHFLRFWSLVNPLMGSAGKDCRYKKRGSRPFDLEPSDTPGSDLLSHAVTHAVPSAVEGLTSVFGMGTGVTLLLWPPGISMGRLRNLRGANHPIRKNGFRIHFPWDRPWSRVWNQPTPYTGAALHADV